ncbi:MAG: transglutaminase-like domain-containing protein [Verrucomicrobiaceae bacterium]
MRTLILILGIGTAYVLVKGWPAHWDIILRSSLAVFTLTLGIAFWGKRPPDNSKQAAPDRPPRWLDFAAIATALLIVEAAFLFFFATVPPAAENLAESLDRTLHPGAYQGPQIHAPEQDSDGNGDFASSGNWLWQDSGQRQLGSVGAIKPSNRPEVYLWPDSPADLQQLETRDIYLRTFTLGSYQNATWRSLPISPQSFAPQQGLITLSPPSPASINYRISHGPNAQGQSLAVSIPTLQSITSPSLRLIAPHTYRLPPLAPEATAYEYQAASNPVFFDPAQHLPATIARPEYRTLPAQPDLLNALTPISSATSGTPSARLAQMRQILAENFRYSLKPGLDPNSDPLLQFLTRQRDGYCEHFATAAALLARQIGFPSRIAYGWSGGRYYETPDVFVFRAKEAHAWTEVKVEGLGWVILETTPASRTEGIASNADPNEKSPLDGDPFVYEEEADLAAAALARLKTTSLSLAGAGLIALLIILIARHPASRKEQPLHRSGLLPPTRSYLLTFRQACAHLGHPMPTGTTLRNHLIHLRKEGLAPPFADELLQYHYHTTYRDRPTQKSSEKRLTGLLKNWMHKTKAKPQTDT